jgi:hypothetical protein
MRGGRHRAVSYCRVSGGSPLPVSHRHGQCFCDEALPVSISARPASGREVLGPHGLTETLDLDACSGK